MKAVQPNQFIDLTKLRCQDTVSAGEEEGSVEVEGFPVRPAISSRIKPLELDEVAKEDMQHAMLCCSKDETRYVLRGVYLDPENQQLVATDGRHLTCFRAPYLEVGALKKPVILPDHKLWNWRGLRPKDQDEETWKLRIGFPKFSSASCSKTAPVFRVDGLHWTLSGKCIEGNFPNYSQVIPSPNQFKTRLEFDPADLGAIAHAVGQLPGKQIHNHPIGLRISDRTAGILYRETENDSYQEIGIPFSRKSGPDLSISLNRDYLLKALRFGLYQLDLGDPISPMKFSNGERGLMIVMPLRNELPDHPLRQVAQINGIEPQPETSIPTYPSCEYTKRKQKPSSTSY